MEWVSVGVGVEWSGVSVGVGVEWSGVSVGVRVEWSGVSYYGGKYGSLRNTVLYWMMA